VTTKWSLGVIIGLPVTILICVLILVFIGYGVYLIRRDGAHEYGGWSIGLMATVGGTVCLIIAVVIAAVAFFPYKAEYHQWRPVNGTIAHISSRILGTSDSINQRFVVEFTDGRLRSCDDTRCALLHEGDWLALSCKRYWQYSGDSGYDCNYVEARRRQR